MTDEQLAEDVAWFSDRGLHITLSRDAFHWEVGILTPARSITRHVHVEDLADGFAELRASIERTTA